MSDLPVVVVGAGPVGLAAAAELVERGLRPLVLEKADQAGAAGSEYPTGAEWASRYLRPLADALGDKVQLGVEVVGVARRGADRVVDAGRAAAAGWISYRVPDLTADAAR